MTLYAEVVKGVPCVRGDAFHSNLFKRDFQR
jgi:hypothetical protein